MQLSNSASPTINKPIIVIIDDDTIMLKVIATELSQFYDVRIAIDGKSGQQIIDNEKNVDLILLDVMLPDTTGFQLCRTLKLNDATRKIPIIFVTALNESTDMTTGFDLGAVDFVTKPLDLAVLKARVKTHVLLKKQLDTMENLAAIDALTQVANKRKFNETLYKEWLRAKREKEDISLLILDIDHFKEYNDNYGHGAGDDCLARVALELMPFAKRSTDIVARIGGEEFAILLTNCDKDGAVAVASNITSHFNQIQLPHEYSSVKHYLTFSIGVASCVPQDDDMQQLLKAADKALYEIKRSSKNNFHIAADV